MRKVFASVSKRLLGEVPKFFGSFETALGELFQNAHRAGATKVDIKLNKDKTELIMSDNGTGIKEPEELLSAGDTGWNEEKVIEPAGLGFFAHIRKEYVKETIVTTRHISGSWRMTLTPAVLLGDAGEVEPVKSNESTGTTLHLKLNKKVFEKSNKADVKECIQKARGLYPMKVTFNGKSLLPIWEKQVIWVLHTPVGTIQLFEKHYYLKGEVYTSTHPAQNIAVWEYKPIVGSSFGKALSHAIKQIEDGRLKKVAETMRDQFEFVWFVESDTGVRPKLPDRNDLNNDDFLSDAVKALITSAAEQLLNTLLEASKKWSDRLKTSEEANEKISRALKLRGRAKLDLTKFLNHIGYSEISHSDLEYIYAYTDMDNGAEVEIGNKFHGYDRKIQAVGSTSLMETLCSQGKLVIKGDENPPEIKIRNFRISEKSPYVALADKIHVEGIGDIPYLFTLDEWDTDNKKIDELTPGLIVVGDALDAIECIREHDLERAIFCDLYFKAGEHYNWVDHDDIDYSGLLRDIIETVSLSFDKDYGRKIKDFYTLGDIVCDLNQTVHNLRELEMKIKSLESPNKRSLRIMHDLKRKLKAQCKTYEGRSQKQEKLAKVA